MTNIDTIAGVVGAGAGVVAATMAVLVYTETKSTTAELDSKNEGKQRKQQVPRSPGPLPERSRSKELSLYLFEQDAAQFDKHNDKIGTFFGLCMLATGGMTYAATQSILFSIVAGFGLGMIAYLTIMEPLHKRWRVRLEERLAEVAPSDALSFVRSHEWKDNDIKNMVVEIVEEIDAK